MTEIEPSALTDAVEKIAAEAGRAILEVYRQDFEVVQRKTAHH